MFDVVDWGLPPNKGPVTNAVKAADKVFTVQIPRDPETGEVRTEGGIEAQTRQCLSNLQKVMKAAGGSMADVTQVLIYLIDSADAPGMNAVYQEFFAAPYPNRATVVVKELLSPGMRIEMVVHAHVGPAH
ncbi:RidA family protein [Afifella sp. IM 167]|uniref:RidA family protein n=1 Tax=Afifella sp. IM 167 TaxID=2033586 RepID=UPI001CCE2F0E|nr:RidA family protein [Afifella sp. IM 167]MBZ8131848.1 enamine deaminase RidA [Afifella sp. IM 167]